MIPNSWDCHTHVLDPSNFPYRSDRKYTPEAASLTGLIESTTAQNIVIVQASPENGEQGLLHHLQAAQKLYPERTFRGTTIADSSLGHDILSCSRETIDNLHSIGIRSIRLQGVYGPVGSQFSVFNEYLTGLASSYPITRLGWSVSIQLPLDMWAELSTPLRYNHSLANITIIADHNGSAKPSDLKKPDFAAFLELLRDRENTYVKIGALHRRSKNFLRMEGLVKALADAGPQQLLWGSDWPHVNTGDVSAGKDAALEVMPHLEEGVDVSAELEAVKSWLTDDQFHNMMVETPAMLFK